MNLINSCTVEFFITHLVGKESEHDKNKVYFEHQGKYFERT